MPECANCGAHISRDFERVFAVEGEVHACPDCPDKPNSGLGGTFSP